MGLFGALNKALSSPTLGGITNGLVQDRRRAFAQNQYDEQKNREQAERDFASEFNKSIVNGDVDSAKMLFDQFQGQLSPQTTDSARREIQQIRSTQQANQMQSENNKTIYPAMAQGATAEEAQMLADAGRAGSGLDAIMGVRKNVQGREQTRKLDILKKLADASKGMTPGQQAQAYNSQGMDAPSGSSESQPVDDAIDKEVTALLARGDITPSQAVDRIERSMGQNFEPDKKADLLSRYSSFSLTPLKTLGAEQLKKVTGASTVQEISEKALDKLGNPKVQEALGRIGGATNKLEGWITGKSSMPTEVVEFLQLLGFGTDFIARKQSGAALTQDEIDFYKTLTGSDLTSPSAIKTQLIGLIETLEDEKMAIYMQPLQIAYQGSVPDEVLEKLPRFKSKHKRGNADPASTSDIFSKVTYNESTGQWEAKDSQ